MVSLPAKDTEWPEKCLWLPTEQKLAQKVTSRQFRKQAPPSSGAAACPGPWSCLFIWRGQRLTKWWKRSNLSSILWASFELGQEGATLRGSCIITKRKKEESEVAQSSPTVCNPMDCSLLGSSIHGIFQARILEWVAISFPRRSSRPRDWTWVFHIVRSSFTVWVSGEVHIITKGHANWVLE